MTEFTENKLTNSSKLKFSKYLQKIGKVPLGKRHKLFIMPNELEVLIEILTPVKKHTLVKIKTNLVNSLLNSTLLSNSTVLPLFSSH